MFANWNNDGPGFGNDVSLVRNTPPIIGNPGVKTVQYSDPLSFPIVVVDPDSPGFSFDVSGLPSGLTASSAAVAPAGFGRTATRTVSGIVTASPGVYPVTISATDDAGETDFETFDIVVPAEDARATYTGPMWISTPNSSTTIATMPLRATLRDITPVDPALSPPLPDSFAGDIRNATAAFVDRATGLPVSPGCANLPIALTGTDGLRTGTATCAWRVDLGAQSSQSFTVGVVVGAYYVRNDASEDTIIRVSTPTGEFTTGGARLAAMHSAGQYAADAGSEIGVTFNAKFQQGGRRLHANAGVAFRRTEANALVGYRIETTTLDSLVVRSAGKTGRAEFFGVAQLKRGATTVATNLRLLITHDDNGEPGRHDTIAISLWSSSGVLVFSSHWNGARTVEHALSGGNVQVH